MDVFRNEYRRLGKMSYEEGVVLVLFVVLAVLWLLRQDIHVGLFTISGWSTILPVPEFVDDGTIAIAIALPTTAAHIGIAAGSERASMMPVTTALRSPSELGFLAIRLHNHSVTTHVITQAAITAAACSLKYITAATMGNARPMITSSIMLRVE